MAKTLIVQLTCDRCKAEKGENVDGAETATFGFDGYDYSLDLCKEHGEDFHNTMQGLISWSSDRTRSGGGRRAKRAASSDDAGASGGPAPAPRSSADRERLKAIRDWARENGHPNLGDRGRVPQAIVAAYDAAH
ncbi:MAG: histone-like nucleoid-structuring protein Lsr2 [Acidimicrobiales bacterium]